MRYEQGFDVARIGSLGAQVTDDGGTFQLSITSGTHIHSGLDGGVADDDGNQITSAEAYSNFAAALTTALNAASSSGTYTVTWSASTFLYTVSYTGATLSISFSGATTPADGTRLRRILGFSVNQTGATSYNSDRRPIYLLVPTIQARSEVKDEYHASGGVTEARADDGSAYQTGVDRAAIFMDWKQHAEPNQVPATIAGAGSAVFKRTVLYGASQLCPWSYQDFWDHLADGKPPFLVVDDLVGNGNGDVFEMRAEGCDFDPVRFKSNDYDLFSFDFKTRLLGRLQ